jgi:hypothetical protein
MEMYTAEELEMTIIYMIKKHDKNKEITDDYKNGAVSALRELLFSIQEDIELEEE